MGILDTTSYSQYRYQVNVAEESQLYIGSGLSSSASVQWAVANLTSQEAQQNKSGYACVSKNSNCLGVNSTDDYIGYWCSCTPGYEGNSYIQDGCKGIITALLPLPFDLPLSLSLILLSDAADINECLVPNKCKGVCHNTPGNYSCNDCPGKTQYDTTTIQCIPTRRQNLMLGKSWVLYTLDLAVNTIPC